MKNFKLILLLGVLTACGGGSSGDGGSSDGGSCGNFKVINGDVKIINGQECSRNNIPTVFLEFSPDGQCTGTVIGEDYVITAAHCVEETTGAKVIHGNGQFDAEFPVVHPQYPFVPGTPYDLALLKVTNIRENLGISKASIGVSESITREDFLTFVGYGDDNGDSKDTYGNSGLDLPNGNPRVTDIGVSDVTGGFIVTRYEETNTNVCVGDSGGAAYKNGKIVGIESFGQNENVCREGGHNFLVDIRIRSSIDFIRAYVPDVELK